MDMSPMIDLVFLLLIFFMVASTVIILPLDQEVKPPIAIEALPAADAKGKILVNVRADGTIVVDGDKVIAGPDATLEEVEAYIAKGADEAASAQTIPKLYIRADKDTEVKRIREVVEAGANAQVINVVFSAYADPNAGQE